MASLKSIVSLLLPLMATCLFYHHSNATFEVMADQDLIADICKQAEDYDFCFSALLSDPRTAAADLHGLALISISLNVIRIQEISDEIPNILEKVNDPVGKQRLGVCQSDYSDALQKFQGALSSSSARSYWDVINWVRDGANKAIDCENIYRRSEPIGVSPISSGNRKVIKMAEITLIIVDRLVSN